MPQTPLTRSALGATWWSAMEITARYGVQFFVVVVLARVLSPNDFGLIAILLVFTSIGVLLADSGFSTALIQRQHSTPDDETTAFWCTSGTGVLLFFVLWLSAPTISEFFEEAQLTQLTRFVAWVLPLSALSAVPDAILTQQLRFKVRAKAQLFGSFGSAIIAIGLGLYGAGAWSLAWQVVSATAIRGTLLWLFSGWRPKGQFRTSSFRSLFGFGGYMLLAGLLDTMSVRLQSFLIGKLFDTHTLGHYTVAQSTQSAPTSFIGGILSRVGLPVFASVANQPKKLLGALRLSLQLALFVFIPCMLGIALVAQPLVELLYGPRWLAAAPILTVLALSAAFWPLHILNLAALNAQGRPDLFLRLEIIKKFVGITLIVICSPGGAVAVAGAVLLASIFGIVVNTWYSKRMLGYGVVAQLWDQRATLALSGTAASIGWVVMHCAEPGAISTLVAVIASMIVYLGGAIVFRHPAVAELKLLVRDFPTSTESNLNTIRSEDDGGR